MGAVGNVLNDILEKIEDITIFFIAYTLIVFVAGQFFGRTYAGTEIFWYPLYLLLFVLIIKVLVDIGRGRKKEKK
jgi:hypothetical protein